MISAGILLDQIHRQHNGYKANFDLEDCDNILRIQSSGSVVPATVILLLKRFGFTAEVLPD